MSERTRNENGYRDTTPKDGRFSPKIEKPVTERFFNYCKLANVNKTKTANTALSEWLDIKEKELLESKSKEELIRLILGR